jgi:hypothetical protein
VPTLRGMACLLVLVTPQAYSLVVGPERGRSIPFSEVATPVIEVGLVGHSGLDLLTVSFSHFDPQETFSLCRGTMSLTGLTVLRP